MTKKNSQAFMEEIEKLIISMFPPEVELLNVYRNYEDKKYIEILNSVDDLDWFNGKSSHYSWLAFLYSGCRKFNRWTGLSQFTVKSDVLTIFRRFVEALFQVENGISDNTSIFVLWDIKSEIFERFNCIPTASIDKKEVSLLLEEVTTINPPVNTNKLREFLTEKEKVIKIISALLSGNIQTKIVTHLPYVIHKSSLSITCSWQKINLKAKLTPTFGQSESVTSSNIPNQPLSPSRWQAGITKVELEFQSLIDYDAWTPSLLELDSESLPFDGWPKGFTIAFEVIDALVWTIRIEYGGETQWLPSPRDISTSEFQILSGGQQIEQKLQTSPAVLMQGFSRVEKEIEIGLEHLKSVTWHVKCRSLAVMYLEIGETNEALIWLNAGIESLFHYRIKDIALKTGRTNLEDELKSLNWNEVKEIVVKQCPELAEKIKKLLYNSHPSMYKKLKYLYKVVKMRASYKELESEYRKISKDRNPLVHGVTSHRLPASEIKEALSSFDWINENFILAEDNLYD